MPVKDIETVRVIVTAPSVTDEVIEQAREDWLQEVRKCLASKSGNIAVRAPFESIQWLREQLSPEEWQRIEFSTREVR